MIARQVQLGEHPIDGTFDLAHLQAIHRRLFGDVYPFAGLLPTVDIHRIDYPGGQFMPSRLVPMRQTVGFLSLSRQHSRAGTGERGFTVVEAMIAMLVLVVGLLGMVSMLDASARVTTQNPEGTYQALERYGRDLTELDADAIVVAAGAESAKLVPGLPIEREDRWLFYSDPIAERLFNKLERLRKRELLEHKDDAEWRAAWEVVNGPEDWAGLEDGSWEGAKWKEPDESGDEAGAT